MLLTHLSLTNYRNFSRLDLDVPGGPVLLVGKNAQGKTSLLEAIYFLATFTSFHAKSDRQLINFLAASEPLVVARIVADFRHKESVDSDTKKPVCMHRLEVRLIQEPVASDGAFRLRKEILLDGLTRKVGETVGVFTAVLFLPQMLRIVEGAPEERRRYLNLAMGQVLPHYTSDLVEYNHVLTQRNALLKQLNERGGDLDQLTYWDEQLAFCGGRIIHARIQTVQELEYLASRFHNTLTRNQEVLRLSYQPAYEAHSDTPLQYSLPFDESLDRSRIPLVKIQQKFLECLHTLRKEEIARGVTTVGPHRDDLRLLGNGLDLGVYGSRGQGRSAILSLKLAEVSWMKEKNGQWPVLLLDEVLAELDADRREDLLERLVESEQTLLTTTDLDMFRTDFVQKSKVWNIQAGQVIMD
jgi:DNA replication and repair protein RecF